MATIKKQEPAKKRFARWFLCRVMGWHNNKHPDQPAQLFDGCSFQGRCSRCGKSVMQDSQGNWY